MNLKHSKVKKQRTVATVAAAVLKIYLRRAFMLFLFVVVHEAKKSVRNDKEKE